MGFGVAGLSLIGLTTIAASEATPLVALAGLPAVIGTAGVLIAGEAELSPVSRLLSARALRGLGRISYSIYLWHWPILLLVPRLTNEDGLGVRLALAAGTVAVAALSTRVIEDPFRFRWGRGFRPRAVLGIGLSASLFVAVATSSLSSMPASGIAALPEVDLAPTEQPAQLRPYFRGPVPSDLVPSLDTAISDVEHIDIERCVVTIEPVTPATCVVGEPSSSTTVVVVGDSKAAQWIPAVDALASEFHWRVIRLTKARCPFVELTVWDADLEQPYYACDEWRAFALRTIERERPELVFVASRRPSDARLEQGLDMASWEQGLEDALTTVAPFTSRVIYFGDTPHVKRRPIVCLEEQQVVEACPTLPVPGAYRELESRAAAAAGALLIPTTDWLCVESRCPLILDRYLVYHDQYHLTKTMSRVLAPQLAWALQQPFSGPIGSAS